MLSDVLALVVSFLSPDTACILLESQICQSFQSNTWPTLAASAVVERAQMHAFKLRRQPRSDPESQPAKLKVATTNDSIEVQIEALIKSSFEARYAVSIGDSQSFVKPTDLQALMKIINPQLLVVGEDIQAMQQLLRDYSKFKTRKAGGTCFRTLCRYWEISPPSGNAKEYSKLDCKGRGSFLQHHVPH